MAENFSRRLAGRTVLVAGAGAGFGAEIAVRAAQEGAQVVVHYNRSREGAEQTAKRIEQAGSRAALVQADITRVPVPLNQAVTALINGLEQSWA